MKKRARFKFRLYIAGDAPNSLRALANLRALCHQHLPERHEIEVVDVLLAPERALAEQVYLTPTLVRLSPGPNRKIVGSLSDITPVLEALGLPA